MKRAKVISVYEGKSGIKTSNEAGENSSKSAQKTSKVRTNALNAKRAQPIINRSRKIVTRSMASKKMEQLLDEEQLLEAEILESMEFKKMNELKKQMEQVQEPQHLDEQPQPQQQKQQQQEQLQEQTQPQEQQQQQLQPQTQPQEQQQQQQAHQQQQTASDVGVENNENDGGLMTLDEWPLPPLTYKEEALLNKGTSGIYWESFWDLENMKFFPLVDYDNKEFPWNDDHLWNFNPNPKDDKDVTKP